MKQGLNAATIFLSLRTMKDKFGNNHKFYFEYISLGTKRGRYTGTWIYILKYIDLNSRKK